MTLAAIKAQSPKPTLAIAKHPRSEAERDTGQRDLGSDLGLMDYNARFYSPRLRKFTQPDTIIPSPANPQTWNRFSYVNNNPIRYTDLTGHYIFEEEPDDKYIWRRDRPKDTRSLIRTKEPVWIQPPELAGPDNLDVTDFDNTNVWDYVPYVKNYRTYSRYGEAATFFSEQEGFMEEQARLQGWQNCGYNACHDSSETATEYGPQYPTMGGPMPDTPLVDAYSDAMGKQANVVTAAVFSKGIGRVIINAIKKTFISILGDAVSQYIGIGY